MMKRHQDSMNGIVQLMLSLFFVEVLFAAQQTHYKYIPKEKTWQANETAHGNIALREQTDDDLKNSECAIYCTSRDSKFE